MREAWLDSRDSKRHAGTSGIDRITAADFGRNLDHNISRIHARLQSGTYTFSKLRIRLIPKKDANKYRLICIPTVADRLVQRALVRSLNLNDRLGVRTDVSFGFLSERGVADAVGRALTLRQNLPWVLKTDITEFFDRIRRGPLLEKLCSVCPPSVFPLLQQVVNCEAAPNTSEEREQLEKQGIVAEVGLRQGMPISPLLSNFVLKPFDKRAIRFGYSAHMVRYADDLIFCFGTKRECIEADKRVREWLSALGHAIPELDAMNTKTKILGPEKQVEFLGIDIAFDRKTQRYARWIPKSSLDRICSSVLRLGSVAACEENNWGFADFTHHMNGKTASYKATYEGTRNLTELIQRLSAAVEQSCKRLLNELIGVETVKKLDARSMRFLGMPVS